MGLFGVTSADAAHDHALVFREGEFAGRELEELFNEALFWWDVQLSHIEKALDGAN